MKILQNNNKHLIMYNKLKNIKIIIYSFYNRIILKFINQTKKYYYYFKMTFKSIISFSKLRNKISYKLK